MELVNAIYAATDSFPRGEDYALKSQLRRAAISIPSDIAEGTGRGTRRDFQFFLRVAKGSAREAETQIEIAQHVGYLGGETASSLQKRVASISRLLNRLIASLDQPAET